MGKCEGRASGLWARGLWKRAVLGLVGTNFVAYGAHHQAVERLVVDGREDLSLQKGLLINAYLGEYGFVFFGRGYPAPSGGVWFL